MTCHETKGKPIIFSGAMVRAILEGRKTQTRRVMRPQPPDWAGDLFPLSAGRWRARHPSTIGRPSAASPVFRCPYGIPGDFLWMRECWAASQRLDRLPPHKLEFLTANRDFPKSTVYYRADSYDGVNPLRGKWRPSIFMPRWASRITLEVTDVKAERVQAITPDDALAEGCPDNALHAEHRGAVPPHRIGPVAWFAELWDSINAKRGFGWDANPWVWVVEFKEVIH